VTFADHIRNRRAWLGLSLGQVARVVKCSRSHIYEVERGIKQPSPSLVRRLAKALREVDSTRLLLDLCADAEVAAVRERWR